MTNPYEIHCEDAVVFLNEAHKLGRRGWIYRGQSEPRCDTCNKSFHRPLKSSLLRFLETHRNYIRPDSWYLRENATLERFKRAAHLHLRHLPETDEHLDWLALMQHYGAPTRMLDFTFNPAVALFFAVENWAGNPAAVSVHAIHVDSVQREARKCTNDVSRTLRDGIGAKPHDSQKKFLGMHDGRSPSDRHLVQEGLFLVPSHIDLDIDLHLASIEADPKPAPHNTHWLKFSFPAELNALREIAKQLMNMGMGPEHLFPGLHGLALAQKFAWLDVK